MTKEQTNENPSEESTETADNQPTAEETEQQELMADLLTDDDQPSEAEPAEKAEPDQTGQPQDAQDTPDAEAKAPQEEPQKDVEAKGEKAEPPDPLETTYEVQGVDGVRHVPAKDLVTTYQQYGNLQRQHVAFKPVIDLAKSAGVAPEQIYPYLELGIKTAFEQQRTSSAQPPGGQTGQVAPDGYAGPFKDADEDAQIKETDPTFHASMWNTHNQLAEMKRMVAGMQNGFNQFQQSAQQAQAQKQYEAGINDLEQRIAEFAGTHTDYFAPDPATGQSEKMNLFKQFLGRHPAYSQMEITEITPEILASAFSIFDPSYYNAYLANQAKADIKKLKAQERAAFAETDNVSGSPVASQLTEQQEVMKGLLGS